MSQKFPVIMAADIDYVTTMAAFPPFLLLDTRGREVREHHLRNHNKHGALIMGQALF